MWKIDVKHINSIIHNMEIGVTEPKFAMLEGDIQAIVKLANGPEGNRILFNEYFSYRFANLLSIDMPESGICRMDDSTEICGDIADKTNIGLAFYSTFLVKVTRLVPTIIPQIVNRNDFLKILLFDHIIYNQDRNPGNLLVRFYKKDIRLKVIDHTHIFKNGAIWDSSALETFMNDKDYFETNIMDSNCVLYNMFLGNISYNKEGLYELVELFRTVFSEDNLVKIIAEIPDEWMPPVDDVKSLKRYLKYRIKHLDEIIETIDRFIRDGRK